MTKPKKTKKTEAEVHRKFEDILSHVLVKFVNIDVSDFDKQMGNVLHELGNFVGTDRSFIFLFNDKSTEMNLEYEWHAKKIKSHKSLWQQVGLKNFSWMLQELKKNGVVNIHTLSQIPSEGDAVKKILKKIHVHSVLVVPLMYKSEMIGFLGFSTIKREIKWPENCTTLLKITSEIIANAIHRKHVQKDLQELDELRNRFIRIVSHQIRTPLAGIRWNLETLLDDGLGKLNESQTAFVRSTHFGTVEVIQRLSDMLTALDIEEGNIRLEKEETDICSLIDSVLIDTKRRARVSNVSLRFTKPRSELPRLSIDPLKMKECIQKVVENAIDYTKQKGKIVIKVQSMKDSIRFCVKDTGIGIPKNEQRHIFERFYRASNAHPLRTDAPGVSLSIVNFYVQEHGGSVGFESIEGEGSHFWIDLPID